MSQQPSEHKDWIRFTHQAKAWCVVIVRVGQTEGLNVELVLPGPLEPEEYRNSMLELPDRVEHRYVLDILPYTQEDTAIRMAVKWVNIFRHFAAANQWGLAKSLMTDFDRSIARKGGPVDVDKVLSQRSLEWVA